MGQGVGSARLRQRTRDYGATDDGTGEVGRPAIGGNEA